MKLVNMKFITILLAGLCLSAQARVFEFKSLRRTSDQNLTGPSWWVAEIKTGAAMYLIKVGAASKTDDPSPIEIRAATLFKSVKGREYAFNDIATYTFSPTNTSQALYFGVKSGTSISRKDSVSSAYDRGWDLSGCVVELHQNGKLLKRFGNSKMALTPDAKQLKLNAKGNDRSQTNSLFDNPTLIYPAANQKGSPLGTARETMALPDVEEPASNSKFRLKSFCGYEFGSEKPDFAPTTFVPLRPPFLHYNCVKPVFSARNNKLTQVAVRVNPDTPRSKLQEQQLEAVAEFEKKYGFKMRKISGRDTYWWSNQYTEIYIYLYVIEIVDLKLDGREDARNGDSSDDGATNGNSSDGDSPKKEAQTCSAEELIDAVFGQGVELPEGFGGFRLGQKVDLEGFSIRNGKLTKDVRLNPPKACINWVYVTLDANNAIQSLSFDYTGDEKKQRGTAVVDYLVKKFGEDAQVQPGTSPHVTVHQSGVTVTVRHYTARYEHLRFTISR